MRRRSTSKKKKNKNRDPDSDRSLSDVDELDQVTYDLGCSSSLQSLLHARKLPTPLEVESLEGDLQGGGEVNDHRKSSMSIELDLFLSEFEKGIHGSIFEECQDLQKEPREEHHTDSSCDSISDEENMVLPKLSVASAAHEFQGNPYVDFVSKNHKGECTWSKITEEAMELSCLHKKVCSSSFISHLSEEKSPNDGGHSRAKTKFSIRLQAHSEKLSSSHSMDREEKSSMKASETFEEHNIIHNRNFEASKAMLMRDLEEASKEPTSKLAPDELIPALPSMAELLEDMEEKNGHTAEALNSKLLKNARSKERKRHCPGRRITPQLGSRILDNDDPLEFMGAGTSSGDEDCNQNHLSIPIEKTKQRTMGDLFLETFNTYAEESPSLLKNSNTGSGYFGRLQQVMQIERDRHLEFLKQPQTGQSSPNDLSCITVRILSRCLEAKLTVCHCLLAESTKMQSEDAFQKFTDVGTTRTVIFHPRMCGTVELEVGRFVRIHPPWKEVLCKNDEKIILCSYFSQTME